MNGRSLAPCSCAPAGAGVSAQRERVCAGRCRRPQSPVSRGVVARHYQSDDRRCRMHGSQCRAWAVRRPSDPGGWHRTRSGPQRQQLCTPAGARAKAPRAARSAAPVLVAGGPDVKGSRCSSPGDQLRAPNRSQRFFRRSSTLLAAFQFGVRICSSAPSASIAVFAYLPISLRPSIPGTTSSIVETSGHAAQPHPPSRRHLHIIASSPALAQRQSHVLIVIDDRRSTAPL